MPHQLIFSEYFHCKRVSKLILWNRLKKIGYPINLSKWYMSAGGLKFEQSNQSSFSNSLNTIDFKGPRILVAGGTNGIFGDIY